MKLSLLVDLYELTMAQSYFLYKKNTWATFDLFVRQLSAKRNFLVACGLEDVLNYIRGLKFEKEDLAYLRKQKLFSAEFLNYLSGFRFHGDVWAMPEGTICFANEPLIRVTAPIIEAQILESFLLNSVNLQTMIASKASRVLLASAGRLVYDFSLRRTHGTDAAIKVARAAYIAGFSGTSNVLAAKLYGIPVVGTMAHSFVMSFRRELESFLAYANTFPQRTILLVDTYNTHKGIENAILVGLFLKKKNYKLLGVRLDSGDIVSLSKLSRHLLEAAGLGSVRIFASGNLDEFKIKELLKRHAEIDNFGVGTNMGTSSDAPSLDVIYKISEVTDREGRFLPTMKLSKRKVTYPGRKQVFRIQDKKGRFKRDILGLEKEKIKGRPLLIKVIDKGRIIYRSPHLTKVRELFKRNLESLPEACKNIDRHFRYPLVISPELEKLRRQLSRHLGKRQ